MADQNLPANRNTPEFGKPDNKARLAPPFPAKRYRRGASGTLIIRAHIHPDPSGAWVTARVVVGLQGAIHRFPVECFPAIGASVDVGRALPGGARRAARSGG